MINKDLTKVLHEMKDEQSLGGSFDFDAAWKTIEAKYAFEASETPRSYSWGEYAEYVLHHLGHHVMRPAAISMSAFVLVFAGWVTAVSASFGSVPGDYLYPVKLATERVQLTFATSGEQRAKLHVEFAGRRLQEITEIEKSDRPGKEVRTKAAIESFTKEIQSANSTLTELSQENSPEAVTLAIVIDQKTDEFGKAIGQAEGAGVEETKEAYADAIVTVEQVNTQAVDAIVHQHETAERPETSESIQKNFQDAFADIKMRITLSHGRLAVIEGVLAKLSGVNVRLYEDRITEARHALTGHDDKISKAMDVFAAGAVRSAFDRLSEVNADVRSSEQIITELEIEISTELVVEQQATAELSGETAGETSGSDISSPSF